jgi:hypothetical protein
MPEYSASLNPRASARLKTEFERWMTGHPFALDSQVPDKYRLLVDELYGSLEVARAERLHRLEKSLLAHIDLLGA